MSCLLLRLYRELVLNTGLRKAALMQLGYSLAGIVKQTRANASELEKLGFGLKYKSTDYKGV